jgi:hypothetical protein
MPTWLGLLIVVVLVASRPIEARLWWAGRISDRTATALLLARFPVVVAIGALATGGWSTLSFGLIAFAALVTVPFYPWLLGVLREKRATQQPRHMTFTDAD